MKKHFLKAKLNKKGFTLVEALIALLIMATVLSMVAYGIPMATKAYKDVVDSADAETVLSTTMNTLRNELANASTITTISNGIKYQRSSTGVEADIFYNADSNDDNFKDGKGLYIQEYPYHEDGEEIEPYSPRLLVTRYASSKDLYTTCTFEFEPTTGILTVHDLAVMKDSVVLTKIDTYYIQTGYKEP